MASENKQAEIHTLPEGVPEEARAILQEVGYFDADRIHVGDQAPALELPLLRAKESVVIGAPGPRPVVLIFGSYT